MLQRYALDDRALASAGPGADRSRLARLFGAPAWVSERTFRSMLGLTALFWLGVSLVCLVTQWRHPHDWVLVPTLPFIAVAGCLLSLPMMAASFRLAEAPIRKRMLLLGALILVLALVESAIDTGVMKLMVPLLQTKKGKIVFAPYLEWVRMNMMLYVWVFVTYATATGLFLATTLAQVRERQLLRATAAADRARLDALRLQINPHFLFNALNASVSLVSLGRNAEAERVLLRLSDFFRSSLSTTGGDMAPLSVEFEDIEAYLDIEAIRFGERLTVTLDLPEDLAAQPVPHLILQPLVENAVKHGVSRASGPAGITVSARREGDALRLEVANSPVSPGATAAGLGIGARNVQARLAVHYGPEARLSVRTDETTYRVILTLPAAEPS